MIGLIEHLEAYLGKIDIGWKDADGTNWPFSLLRFTGGPVANTTTYTTLGLSDTPLRDHSGKEIRHELMLMTRSAFGDRGTPGILHQVAMEAITQNRPYLCGDVIGPRGKLFTDTDMEALFVYLPVYFPDAFAWYEASNGPGCVVAWLIPITHAEAHYVLEHGWKLFVDVLLRSNPDLIDMHRSTVV